MIIKIIFNHPKEYLKKLMIFWHNIIRVKHVKKILKSIVIKEYSFNTLNSVKKNKPPN